jgi:hypothetical protein
MKKDYCEKLGQQMSGSERQKESDLRNLSLQGREAFFADGELSDI